VQVRDDQERDHHSEHGRDHRVERMRQGLLAEGTDTQARQCDPELHGSDEARRVSDDALDSAGAPVALLGQLLNPRPPRRHERVLARDEESVQQDQRRDAEEL